MRTTYDPRVSVARALERWGKRTKLVRLEAGRQLVCELELSDAAVAVEEIVCAAEDWFAALGRDGSLQVTGYDGASEKPTGTLPLRVRGVADDGASRDDERTKLVAQLMAHNERTNALLVEQMRGAVQASSTVLDVLTKRLAVAEKERADAETRMRAFEDVANEALKAATALKNGEGDVGERLMKAVFERWMNGEAVRALGAPAETKGDGQVVNGQAHPAATEGASGG